MKRFFLVFMVLVGCSPTSMADLLLEGEAETKKLAKELSVIETREGLQKALPQLRNRFNRIADLLIRVRKVAQEAAEPTEASEALFAEMARLYEIPGCRELIENAQADAIRKLGRK